MRESGEFVPFVRYLGEHLNGYGHVCTCVQDRIAREQQPFQNPAVVPLKKLIRVRTWADDERAEAERRGVRVYLQSRDWGKP
jgi:hypothetical protein